MDHDTEGNLRAAGWLMVTFLVLILVGLLLTGCATRQPRTWDGYERDIRAGKYQYIETKVWYRGQWVPVLDPRWTPEVSKPKKGPRT